MRTTVTILAGLLLAAPLLASIPEIPDPDAGGIDAHMLIGYRVCRVTEVREARTLVLFDEGDGQEHVISLDPKLKIRAQSKRQFDGRRKLQFEDLAVGQRLKVNFRKSDGGIVGIDVLKPAKR